MYFVRATIKMKTNWLKPNQSRLVHNVMYGIYENVATHFDLVTYYASDKMEIACTNTN